MYSEFLLKVNPAQKDLIARALEVYGRLELGQTGLEQLNAKQLASKVQKLRKPEIDLTATTAV